MDNKEIIHELCEALSWALDVQDMTDQFLIDLGQPEKKVRSVTHMLGKEKARKVLEAVRKLF